MPNVKFFFSHKLTGADFRKNKAWFEVMTSESATGRAREIEIDFDLMIGADGAHSAVRYHMMKYVQMNYRQDYIDTLWCEFHIAPKGEAADGAPQFKISPNHLHIWPGKDFMFIAIPSTVCVLAPCTSLQLVLTCLGWLLHIDPLHAQRASRRLGARPFRPPRLL